MTRLLHPMLDVCICAANSGASDRYHRLFTRLVRVSNYVGFLVEWSKYKSQLSRLGMEF